MIDAQAGAQTIPTWEESLHARRWPAPCSKHYTQGYADGYSLITPQPPRHSTAASRPAWLLDNADWYLKGYNHGYEDRAEAGAQAAAQGESNG